MIQILNVHVQFTPKLGLHTTDGATNVTNNGIAKEATSDYFRPPVSLENSCNTSEDLAALDKLITYLLGQPNGTGTGHFDSWRHSYRASARGYKQLLSTGATVEKGDIDTNINTTPL